MRSIINFMNWLNDMDWGWWPFLRLRPGKDGFISNAVALKLTPFFGTCSGVLIWLLSGANLALMSMGIALILGWVLFFMVFRLTFGAAWNYRARTLRGSAEKSASLDAEKRNK